MKIVVADAGPLIGLARYGAPSVSKFPPSQLEPPDTPSVYNGPPFSLEEMDRAINIEAGKHT